MRLLIGRSPAAAAVLVLDNPAPSEWVAALARETNLSETGFATREELSEAGFRLRWFTPTVEVELCSHATAMRDRRAMGRGRPASELGRSPG
jgi:PhzF family phenazine biosynthesis protein